MKEDIFKLNLYGYHLSPHLIAQSPLNERDQSRLLICDRKTPKFYEGIFKDIVNLLKEGDVLVLNNTRVIKARLRAQRKSGGKLEVLLLKQRSKGIWEVLIKPGKRAKIGDTLIFEDNLEALVLDRTYQGGRVLQFYPIDIEVSLSRLGAVPLPPYIKKEIDDSEKYQTIYAKKEGAVAAPTAGFHFTKRLLKVLQKKGVKIAYTTLHCGLSTFRPVKTQDIRDHKMEPEWVEILPPAAEVINQAKRSGRRVVAVGTTSVRAVESASFLNGQGLFCVRPLSQETNLYILPGYEFKIVDALITNFHTPYSTNLILVASFWSRGFLLASYKYARDKNFRFYSFGDAMFVVPFS